MPACSIPLLILFFLFPSHAFAHKIHVFAWVANSIVTVEAEFSSNRPLIEGKVVVKDKVTNTILLQGKSNSKGIFTFQIPEKAKKESLDLLITVSGGEGHQSDWLITAADYLSQKEQSQAQPVTASASQKITPLLPGKIDQTEFTTILAELLEKELAPIKRSLAKAENRKPDLRDILGGLGYLLGLAGLVAWLRNRPQKKD